MKVFVFTVFLILMNCVTKKDINITVNNIIDNKARVVFLKLLLKIPTIAPTMLSKAIIEGIKFSVYHKYLVPAFPINVFVYISIPLLK